MTHPAGIKSSWWIGDECEGKLTGKSTLFLRRSPPHNILEAALKLKVEHVFLTEEFEDWQWLKGVLIPLADKELLPITVARYEHDVPRFLDDPTNRELRLVARVASSLPLSRLRVGDEISIGQPYNLLTYEYDDGVRSLPSMYENDWTVEGE